MITSNTTIRRRYRPSLRKWLAAVLAITAVAASPAHAGILGFSGDVALIPPPPSVESEQLVSNAVAASFLFVERERYTLPTAVDVDWDSSIAASGTILEGTGFFPGTLPAGTEVDSIYFHFDTPQQALGGVVVDIATDAPILGVILTPALLDASDAVLGAPGTLYPDGLDFRGTAGQVTEADIIDISPFLNAIRITSQVEAVLDGLRILTAPVPEPATSLLAAMCFVGTVFLGRRRL